MYVDYSNLKFMCIYREKDICYFLAWRLNTAQYGKERLLIYMERFIVMDLLFIFIETIVSKCIHISDIKHFYLTTYSLFHLKKISEPILEVTSVPVLV